MDNRVLTIDQFCDRYSIGRSTAYHLIRTGKLLARKLGRRTILLPPDVDAWAASLPMLGASGSPRGRYGPGNPAGRKSSARAHLKPKSRAGSQNGAATAA